MKPLPISKRLRRKNVATQTWDAVEGYPFNPDGPEAADLIDEFFDAAQALSLGEPTARQRLLDVLAKARGEA